MADKSAAVLNFKAGWPLRVLTYGRVMRIVYKDAILTLSKQVWQVAEQEFF